MSSAMLRLAADPETAAVVVITGGAIDYPAQPMPYDLLLNKPDLIPHTDR